MGSQAMWVMKCNLDSWQPWTNGMKDMFPLLQLFLGVGECLYRTRTWSAHMTSTWEAFHPPHDECQPIRHSSCLQSFFLLCCQKSCFGTSTGELWNKWRSHDKMWSFGVMDRILLALAHELSLLHMFGGSSLLCQPK